MTHKLLTAAAVIAMTAASAFAQDVKSKNPLDRTYSPATDEERMMYESNRDLYTPFFNEDWTEIRSDDEILATFEAMGADDQAAIREACQKAAMNRTSYGSVTTALCGVVDADNPWSAG